MTHLVESLRRLFQNKKIDENTVMAMKSLTDEEKQYIVAAEELTNN